MVRAAVLYETKTPLSIEEVRLDPPKAREVRVKIAAAGVCRSDLHVINGEAGALLPVVPGHEGAGVVMEVGEGVESVSRGDHVILVFVSSCGQCYMCTVGRPNLCETHARTPTTLMDGTGRLHALDGRPLNHLAKLSCFAEEVVVPESACLRIDSDFPLEHAALVGCCVTTGVGASMFNAQVEPGSTVAVIGCGGVGLNVVQGARLANASRIIAVDVNEAALEFASRFGATDVVSARHEDASRRVREMTDGRGVDYAFEVFGSGETITTAFNSTRRGGTIVVIGLAPVDEPVGFEAMALVRAEKTVKGSYYGTTRPRVDMYRMIDLANNGKIDIGGLITRRYSLDQINEAYEQMEAGAIGRSMIVF